MCRHSHTVTPTSNGTFTRAGKGRTSEVHVGTAPVVKATASHTDTTVRQAPSNVTLRTGRTVEFRRSNARPLELGQNTQVLR